jgi:hypothetical protein
MPVVHKREPHDIYIGRPSRWGNPYSVKRYGRRRAIELHRAWLWQEIRAGKITLEELAELDGQTLGCWCAPKPCHGDTLEAAARWAAERIAKSPA